MLIYKDFKSKSGKWYTFRPLNVMDREEFARRFNSMGKFNSVKEQLVNDPDGSKAWNVNQILRLYKLSIDDFEISELDELLLEVLLKVNFETVTYDEPATSNRKAKNSDKDFLSILFNSSWGVADSAGDALFIMNKLPAEILLQSLKLRSEDLERMYSSSEDKRKKETRDLRRQMIEQAKSKQNSVKHE